MKRRDFLTAASAAALAPLIPTALAASAPAAATGTSLQYVWASYYAQLYNKCSPAMLQKALQVSPDVANSLFSRLLANGSIGAPGLGGLAKAAKPYYSNMRSANAVPGKAMEKLRKVADRVEKAVEEDLLEPEEQRIDPTPEVQEILGD